MVAATFELKLQRGDSVLPCALLQAGVACIWPPRPWRGSPGFLLIRIPGVSIITTVCNERRITVVGGLALCNAIQGSIWYM